MPNRFRTAPSPQTFADTWVKDVLAPAVKSLQGADGQVSRADIQGAALQGAGALAKDNLAGIFDVLGGQSASADALLEAGRQYALSHAQEAAGTDGRLSMRDATRLPHQLQSDFLMLRTGEGVAPLDTKGYRLSRRVLEDVAGKYGLTDTQAIVDKAIERSGDKYLNRSELDAAAAALTAPPQDNAPEGYRWAASSLAKVMTSYHLQDEAALLQEATRHDDGNKYLKRSELEAAAKVLTNQVPDIELGIIADLDKTIIPRHGRNDPVPPPYPGIQAILHELEFGNGGQAGDLTYVTARGPNRVVDIPDYLEEHEIPTGPIETGVSGVPWLAEPEKVKDASVAFDANPDQDFVLFGDTSHRDPEVYKTLLKKYPGRVKAAFIHKVNASVSPGRVEGLHLIENYAEAAAIMFNKGIIDEPAARRIMDSAQLEGLNITDAEIDALIDEHRP